MEPSSEKPDELSFDISSQWEPHDNATTFIDNSNHLDENKVSDSDMDAYEPKVEEWVLAHKVRRLNGREIEAGLKSASIRRIERLLFKILIGDILAKDVQQEEADTCGKPPPRASWTLVYMDASFT
ncbi:hypothetical protein N7517_008093 [Penicillium concentricum]|uniref:Uncharacterized protein n=1 Tax=Penicillium concentricum TaxID=293559 RepID=A0A9W9RS14_9EURO|nr:uncharacterized protein N7517_008093 [Penicillium concentricum]KAJ5365207.1 hypothetical protein N7517_008093 [Penicillium concentricum]